MLHWYPNGVSVPQQSQLGRGNGGGPYPIANANHLKPEELMLVVANALHSILPQRSHC